MPQIAVPVNAIARGPGYLYRAVLGTPVPGGVLTASNKALTSNVATITTADPHGLQVGNAVTVALSPADTSFDGTYTVTGVPTTTTFTYAKTASNVASASTAGSVTGPGTGGTVAGSVFTDAWPAAWVPVGVTRDGSQFSYEITTEDIEVAEYKDPVETDEVSRAIGIAFDLAQITNRSYLMAWNGGTSVTVSGSGATLLTRIGPPALGQSVKTMIGWESEDGTERFVWYEALQSGNISSANQKSPNYKSLPLTFKVTQPDVGDPFNGWLAGTQRVVAA